MVTGNSCNRGLGQLHGQGFTFPLAATLHRSSSSWEWKAVVASICFFIRSVFPGNCFA